MVNPAAAPGLGLGTLPPPPPPPPPPDDEDSLPIVEVLLCQSQRGRQPFVCC